MSDLGPLSFYLGIEVHQDDFGITLRQTAYAKRVVELAGLTDCNPALRWRRWTLRSTGVLWGAFATSPTHGRTWHSPLAMLVGSCSDQ